MVMVSSFEMAAMDPGGWLLFISGSLTELNGHPVTCTDEKPDDAVPQAEFRGPAT